MATATAPRKGKPKASPAPTKAGSEEQYRQRIEQISQELSELDVQTLHLAWTRASKAFYALQELEREFDQPKERMYEDLARGNPWKAQTIKKAILTCGRLETLGFTDIFVKPASGFTQIADILNAKKLSDEARKGLIVQVYKHDKKDVSKRHTVQEVRGMIKDLEPPTEDQPDWKRGTDLWTFPDHDERYGVAGFPGRFPGQAVLNLISRFTTGTISVLSVGCGGGTVLDVCSKSELKGLVGNKYRGLDLKLHPRVLEHHPNNVIEMDCTQDPEFWDRACPPEWADLAIVTLPLFEWTSKARTEEPTDLGNVNNYADWVGLMKKAIEGAYSRLNTQGILAVHSRSGSCFENGTPIADIDYYVIRAIQELTNFFEARIVLDVRKGKPKAAPGDANWVAPHAEYIHVYRKID